MLLTSPSGSSPEAVASNRLYNCFLMSDQYALARAVAEGGTRLTDSDLSNPF
jgi:hypothetical protein